LVSSVKYDDDTTANEGDAGERTLTTTEIQQLRDAGYDVSSTDLSVGSSVNGWSFRAFAGLGINILIIKANADVVYNFNTASFGGSIGARVQF
jgi:hypothetical protein